MSNNNVDQNWFKLPEGQSFPHERYVVKSHIVVGTCKSKLKKNYLVNKFDAEWGKDNVMHIVAKDLLVTIQAITLESHRLQRKQVFHIIIDARENRYNLNQLYYGIRHELKKHAEMVGGNAGGLVFISIIVQDFSALDIRLRRAIRLITINKKKGMELKYRE